MNEDGVFPHVFLIQVPVHEFYQQEFCHFFIDAGISKHPVQLTDYRIWLGIDKGVKIFIQPFIKQRGRRPADTIVIEVYAIPVMTFEIMVGKG